MDYINTFISQSNPFNFLNSLYDYLHKESQKNFFFELVFSTDDESIENYADYFFNKYQDEVQKYQIVDQEISYFKDSLLKKNEFVRDAISYLKNDGCIIIHIFYDLIDLTHIYEKGFENTVNHELLRFEIYKLDWEVIKLPNPYLYVDQLSEDLYQQIDDNYDLINLGQSTISLRQPWHITLNYISNKNYPKNQIFNEKNEVFLQFNKIISDISKQLCGDE